jgi:hypothetical protein
LRNIGFETPSWEDLGYLLISIIVAVSLIGAAWAQWERTRQDPWLRLLHAARHKLQKAGLELTAESTPRQLARALKTQITKSGIAGATPPDPARATELERIHEWLLRLEAWRYAPGAGTPTAAANTLGTLRRQFRQIRWPQQLNH